MMSRRKKSWKQGGAHNRQHCRKCNQGALQYAQLINPFSDIFSVQKGKNHDTKNRDNDFTQQVYMNFALGKEEICQEGKDMKTR